MNPDRDLSIDIAKFEMFWPIAYPASSKIPLLTKFMRTLVKDDIVQLGQLFEKAISKKFKLVRESTTGRDFECGDDAKCVVARTSGHGRSYSANVCSTHAKTGTLLVAVYERKQKKWYFFRIPHSAYKDIPKTSNIDIPFELDGTPRRIPKNKFNSKSERVKSWWRFEVDFNNLA